MPLLSFTPRGAVAGEVVVIVDQEEHGGARSAVERGIMIPVLSR
jgi:hypothetical protein